MASLTQASIVSRKIIRFTIYFFVLIIIVRISIGTAGKIFRFFFPEPPPPPTVTFGKLPSLPFLDTEVNVENLTFNLETIAGELPEFTDQLRVYFMPRASAGIKDLEIARQKAVSLGFSPSGSELVETVFIFQNKTAPSRLTMNIVSHVFSISYDLRANPQAVNNIPPAPEVAGKQAKSFLTKAEFLKDDLTGPETYNFIKIVESDFSPAVSLSDSDIIKVNIFRKDFNELPSLSSTPGEANVWFMLSGGDSRTSPVIAAEYKYYPVAEDQNATYPIKTSQQAWDDLKAGKGFIADLGENESIVTVRKVYLAYYDAGQYTEFYQPIVVFEGDNNFMGYVPAVTDDYYGE